jgi:hypothetical protein
MGTDFIFGFCLLVITGLWWQAKVKVLHRHPCQAKVKNRDRIPLTGY